MRRFLLLLGPLALLFCCVVPACANCCIENYDSTFCGTIRNVPSLQYPSIQDAINASGLVQGLGGGILTDTILVSPGTYYENVDFLGKPICVTSTLSTDPTTQAAAAAATIIDGSLRGPAIFSSVLPPNTGELPSELTFFTIQHGGLPAPGGPASSYGGINTTYASPNLISGNIITNNNYGGIVLQTAAQNPYGGVAGTENNTISNNTCWGILVAAGIADVGGNDIFGTRTPTQGCTYDSYGNSKVTNSSGILVDTGDLPFYNDVSTFIGNTIEKNVQATLAGAPVAGGAGILIKSGNVAIVRNTIRNNSAPAARGGAVDVEGGNGISLLNNLIYGNLAGCGGAAIAFNFQNLEVPSITALFINGMVSTYSMVVANNTIADNSVVASASCPADSQLEFAANYAQGPTALFINNVISSSVASPAMNCQTQPTPSIGSQAVFDHNLLYNAGQAFFGTYCVDESSNGLFGNIVADPQFYSPASGPYQLTPPTVGVAGSPGIDAGNNAILGVDREIVNIYNHGLAAETFINNEYDAVDIIGNSRYLNATGKMDALGNAIGVIDIGAYEAAGTYNGDNAVSVFMFPGGYPTDSGDGTLSAYALQNFGDTNAPATGTLTFLIDNQQAGSPQAMSPRPNSPYDQTQRTIGVASEPHCFTSGTHVLTATYQPVPGKTTAQSQAVVLSIPVPPVVIALEVNPQYVALGTAVTFTIAVSDIPCSNDIPAHSLTLVDVNTGAIVGTVAVDPTTGAATLTTANLHLGLNVIVAQFAGNANYPASNSNKVTVTVRETASLTVSSSANTVYAFAPFTLTGTITPVPSSSTPESIEFYASTNGSAPSQIGIGTISPNGTALQSESLPPGTYTITANYVGDITYAPSVSPSIVVTVIGNPTTVTLSSALNPANAFQPIPLTAHITPTGNVPAGSITGTVTFTANGVSVGSAAVDANGDAKTSISLAAGQYNLVAKYSGDTSFAAAASAALPELVTADGTQTTLTATPNPGYTPNELETLTATVTALSSSTLPPGPVTFTDTFGGLTTTLGSTTLSASGQSVLAVTTLAPGVHSLTATYAPTANFQGSTSSPRSITILLRDFSIATNPSITIQTTHHALLPVTLTSLGGFADSVTLNCGTVPMWASCNFPSGPSFALAANGTVTTNIDIDTDAILNFASKINPRQTSRHNTALFAALLPLALFALRRRGRAAMRPAIRLTITAALLLAATLATGCSGMQPRHTLPGTYTITLTGKGTTTAQTHSTTFTLVVTP